MFLTEDRPLLRKAEDPAAVLRIVHVNRVENMLNDSGLLIVGLLDEKAVVLDTLDGGLLFRGLGGDRGRAKVKSKK